MRVFATRETPAGLDRCDWRRHGASKAKRHQERDARDAHALRTRALI
jgi:hypothetical protein